MARAGGRLLVRLPLAAASHPSSAEKILDPIAVAYTAKP